MLLGADQVSPTEKIYREIAKHLDGKCERAATGELTPVCTLMPLDPAGVSEIVQIIFTPDARTWAYSYRRLLSDLYLVKGLQ